MVHPNWSKANMAKTVAAQMERLIDILKVYKTETVPDKPRQTTPEQNHQLAVGTLIFKVKELERERIKKSSDFNLERQQEWQQRMESGEAATAQNIQQMGREILDQSKPGGREDRVFYIL